MPADPDAASGVPVSLPDRRPRDPDEAFRFACAPPYRRLRWFYEPMQRIPGWEVFDENGTRVAVFDELADCEDTVALHNARL